MSILVYYKKISSELRYTLDIAFNVFLGIDYYFIPNNDNNNIIIKANDSEVTLELNATFWGKLTKKNAYSRENIPSLPLEEWKPKEHGINPSLLEDNIPILFGSAASFKKKSTWHIDIDIFATLFFMLSRYEETIVKTTDNHQRFPASASLAYQGDFLHRPIVDEYIEILWSCIKQNWPQLERKQRKQKILISCDVDAPYSPAIKSLTALGRQVAGDIIKRKNIKKAINSVINPLASLNGNYHYEAYNTFDWIMDVNEQAGNKVAFYFISDHSAGTIDGCYNLNEPRIRELMTNIHKRGHEIGLHGSYNTFQNPQQIKKEATQLKKTLQELNISQDKFGSRQHFLRWKSSETAQHLSNADLISYDTSLSFADRPGFRCGTCHEYPMYDLKTRQALTLIQRPLIVMECSVIADRYMGLGYSQKALDAFLFYKNTCKKFNGNFTLLWHNSHLTTDNDKTLYKELIK
jgi:hypothetical protein